MAYNTQFGPQARFRESLKYEDIIHNQVEAIRQILNSGEAQAIANSTKALVLLVAPYVDEQYRKEKKLLDADEEEKQQAKIKEFERQVRQARGGCPDLVERPTEEKSEEYWEMVFMAANSFIQRKNLGLKNETVAYD